MTVTHLEKPDEQLDASGLHCPLPILKTRKAMSSLATGDKLLVLSTDPGSVRDMESFCRQTGNDLMSTLENDGRYEFMIRKG
jgi:tRNA 2-thiouridine synthesizing protein A